MAAELILALLIVVGDGAPVAINGSSGSVDIISFEAIIVSAAVVVTLLVVIVACAGGCCKIFSKRRQDTEETPQTFNNPIADLRGSNGSSTISPIDVRALELDPIVFEPLPPLHDLTPDSTQFYNSLPRFDNSGRRLNRVLDARPHNYSTGTPSGIVPPSDATNIYAHDWFDEPFRSFPRDHVEFLKEVGEGWFGKVIEAEAEDIVPFAKKLRVLVKVLREDANGTEQMRFLDEVRVFRDANHGNILKLLGHSIETLPFLLMMEQFPLGDLKAYLIANVGRAELFNAQCTHVRMALDVARGLEWMANEDFVHKDLAARNCQVGSEGRIIIGDYGLSTLNYHDDYYWDCNVAIPLRWCAPETLRCTMNTIHTLKVYKASNVWTFGVVLWEICEFGKLPYSHLSDQEVADGVITEHITTLKAPARPGLQMKNELFDIMLQCWNFKRDARPTMTDIVKLLANTYEQSKQIQSHPSQLGEEEDFDKRWELGGKTPQSLGVKVSLLDSRKSPSSILKRKSVTFIDNNTTPLLNRTPIGNEEIVSRSSDILSSVPHLENEQWNGDELTSGDFGKIAKKLEDSSRSATSFLVLTHVEPNDISDSLNYSINQNLSFDPVLPEVKIMSSSFNDYKDSHGSRSSFGGESNSNTEREKDLRESESSAENENLVNSVSKNSNDSHFLPQNKLFSTTFGGSANMSFTGIASPESDEDLKKGDGGNMSLTGIASPVRNNNFIIPDGVSMSLTGIASSGSDDGLKIPEVLNSSSYDERSEDVATDMFSSKKAKPSYSSNSEADNEVFSSSEEKGILEQSYSFVNKTSETGNDSSYKIPTPELPPVAVLSTSDKSGSDNSHEVTAIHMSESLANLEAAAVLKSELPKESKTAMDSVSQDGILETRELELQELNQGKNKEEIVSALFDSPSLFITPPTPKASVLLTPEETADSPDINEASVDIKAKSDVVELAFDKLGKSSVNKKTAMVISSDSSGSDFKVPHDIPKPKLKIKKTSTPNGSPSHFYGKDADLNSSVVSDVFEEDFTMHLSQPVSPIRNPDMKETSVHHTVLMGPSDDLGLKPFQKITSELGIVEDSSHNWQTVSYNEESDAQKSGFTAIFAGSTNGPTPREDTPYHYPDSKRIIANDTYNIVDSTNLEGSHKVRKRLFDTTSSYLTASEYTKVVDPTVAAQQKSPSFGSDCNEQTVIRVGNIGSNADALKENDTINFVLGSTEGSVSLKATFEEDIIAAAEELGSLVLTDLEADEQSEGQLIKETAEVGAEDSFDSVNIRKSKLAFDTGSAHGDAGKETDGEGHHDSKSSDSSLGNQVEDIFGSLDLEQNYNDADEGGGDGDRKLCINFVPSRWNQNATPRKPSIKSPEQNRSKEDSCSPEVTSGLEFKTNLKKSVSFEKKRTQLVYQYPPPPPASDSDDEEKAIKASSLEQSSRNLLDWELQPDELDNVLHEDFEEDFTKKQRNPNPIDMYRISGFENVSRQTPTITFGSPAVGKSRLNGPGSSSSNFQDEKTSKDSTVTSEKNLALGELKHTKGKLKLDLSMGEASILDNDARGMARKSFNSKVLALDSGVGSATSTNVSPSTDCDNTN